MKDSQPMTDAESAQKLQELLAQLDATLGELEAGPTTPRTPSTRLATMAELAREVQDEVDRLRRETPEGDARA